MGEIAQGMVEGVLCGWCGTYIEGHGGYPQLCEGCWEVATPAQKAEWKHRHEDCSSKCRDCNPKKGPRRGAAK